MLLETTMKEGSYLAAFEALGRTIEVLKRDVRYKDEKIKELQEKLTKVGGHNEW
jgi:chaperonin cofactor prefoldin